MYTLGDLFRACSQKFQLTPDEEEMMTPLTIEEEEMVKHLEDDNYL